MRIDRRWLPTFRPVTGPDASEPSEDPCRYLGHTWPENRPSLWPGVRNPLDDRTMKQPTGPPRRLVQSRRGTPGGNQFHPGAHPSGAVHPPGLRTHIGSMLCLHLRRSGQQAHRSSLPGQRGSRQISEARSNPRDPGLRHGDHRDDRHSGVHVTCDEAAHQGEPPRHDRAMRVGCQPPQRQPPGNRAAGPSGFVTVVMNVRRRRPQSLRWVPARGRGGQSEGGPPRRCWRRRTRV